METHGAILTTSESILFQLMGSAEFPKFREISGLVKAHNQIPNEFQNDNDY